jgi:hydroxyacylglutathione hydrolase
VSLRDGDSLEWKDGSTLRVLHTPGHARGHISLLYDAERALFCGDCIPLRGEMPIYEDVIALVKSIKRLRNTGGLELLLSSWDVPRHGCEVYEVMDEALSYFQDIHRTVSQARTELDAADVPMIAKQVSQKLGLPETALTPLLFKTVEAHLRVGEYRDLVAL